MLRKDVAERLGITAQMPIAERAKKLKGMTIAIQGVGSIVHAWERYVVATGGLDVEKDVRIAPMDPPAMLPALENKAIDGYATSMPFTTAGGAEGRRDHAGERGDRRARAGAVRLWPDLHAAARPASKSARCARAWRAPMPAPPSSSRRSRVKTFEILKKRFPHMDPALLARSLEAHAASAHAKDIRVTIPQLENSQKVSLDAKLLDPKDALKSYDGLYTDEFLK